MAIDDDVRDEARFMDRRRFLRQATLLSSGLLLFGRHAWSARASLPRPGKRLVVVFLRGAVDGLNVVVPHGEPAYYDARPTIALEAGSGSGAVLDLDGYFGLHPALAPLLGQWRDGTMAFVHAAGSPDPTRSHFDAQDYMESGTPGVKTTPDGWMDRVLAAFPGPHPTTEAVSLGAVLPRILSGPMPVANVETGRAAARPTPLDHPRIEQIFDRLYAGHDALSRAYREGVAARRKLFSELEADMTEADAGAPSPIGFSRDAERLARLMVRDSTIRLAFMSLGGWDTHVNQGASHGRLANHLGGLGRGLSQFVQALGPVYDETVILVISEFGRTVRENGNAGTDHGHGNVMWALGGKVRGKRVYGKWPGLKPSQLYQDRDLAVTTDFREVVGEVLRAHLGLDHAQLERVFPHHPRPSGHVSGLIAS